MNKESEWCWCSPCALIQVVIWSAVASHIWMNIDWTYCLVAVIVLTPAIAVFVHEEREDLHDGAQSLVAEVWWLFKGWRKTSAKPTTLYAAEDGGKK